MDTECDEEEPRRLQDDLPKRPVESLAIISLVVDDLQKGWLTPVQRESGSCKCSRRIMRMKVV